MGGPLSDRLFSSTNLNIKSTYLSFCYSNVIFVRYSCVSQQALSPAAAAEAICYLRHVSKLLQEDSFCHGNST